jgi:hypothetical protein
MHTGTYMDLYYLVIVLIRAIQPEKNHRNQNGPGEIYHVLLLKITYRQQTDGGGNIY